jgi:hypothetical protein
LLFLWQILSQIGMFGVVSFSKSDKEIPFDQPGCGQILFFKTNLSHFEFFMKVVNWYA